MDIRVAYRIVATHDPEAVLHADHICADPIAHDSAHCALDESEQYTAADAHRDTARALRRRVRAARKEE